MSKEHKSGKENKKQPLKSAKEKRNDKLAKKANKGLFDKM